MTSIVFDCATHDLTTHTLYPCQALDYVYYLLRVFEGEGKKEHEDVGNVRMADFIDLAMHIRDVNTR